MAYSLYSDGSIEAQMPEGMTLARSRRRDSIRASDSYGAGFAAKPAPSRTLSDAHAVSSSRQSASCPPHLASMEPSE